MIVAKPFTMGDYVIGSLKQSYHQNTWWDTSSHKPKDLQCQESTYRSLQIGKSKYKLNHHTKIPNCVLITERQQTDPSQTNEQRYSNEGASMLVFVR